MNMFGKLGFNFHIILKVASHSSQKNTTVILPYPQPITIENPTTHAHSFTEPAAVICTALISVMTFRAICRVLQGLRKVILYTPLQHFY